MKKRILSQFDYPKKDIEAKDYVLDSSFVDSSGKDWKWNRESRKFEMVEKRENV